MKTSRFVRYVIDLPDSGLHAGKTCVRIWDDVAKCDIRLSDFMFEAKSVPVRKTKSPAETGWTLGNVIDIQLNAV